MLKFIIECLGIGILAGISASVYYSVIRHELPNAVAKFFADHEGKAWTKPLWFCVTCISGQLGLWSFLLLKVLPAIGQETGHAGAEGSPGLYWLAKGLAVLFGLIFTCSISISAGMFITRGFTILKHTASKFS